MTNEERVWLITGREIWKRIKREEAQRGGPTEEGGNLAEWLDIILRDDAERALFSLLPCEKAVESSSDSDDIPF